MAQVLCAGGDVIPGEMSPPSGPTVAAALAIDDCGINGYYYTLRSRARIQFLGTAGPAFFGSVNACDPSYNCEEYVSIIDPTTYALQASYSKCYTEPCSAVTPTTSADILVRLINGTVFRGQ